MHYYQFRIAEWMLSTAHLSVEEEGVYRRLIDHYYDTETPIPEKTQPVIRRLRLKGYEETVSDILEEFFVLEEGFWHHKRCDKEIAEYHANADRARKNGKSGGRPKKENSSKTKEYKNQKPKENPEKTNPVNSGFENKTQTKANQKPVTSNQEPVTNNISGAQARPSDSKKTKRVDQVSQHSETKSGPPAPPDDKKPKRFTPPSLLDVEKYFFERGCYDPTEPAKFVNFYESKGWMVGKNKMKNWQAAVRNWLTNNARPRASPRDNTTRDRSLHDDLTDRSWARPVDTHSARG